MSQPEAGGNFLTVARAAAEAAVDQARDRGVRVTAVVLDSTFTVAVTHRMDGAYPSSVPVAHAKAHTALNFGAATEVMAARVRPENQSALQRLEPSLLFVGGGVPIQVAGRRVGAIGVSGGSEDDDIACAQAGTRSAGQALAPASAESAEEA